MFLFRACWKSGH